MLFLVKWIGYALIIMFLAWLLPGISVSGFWGAMFVAVILGLINIFIKPLLMFISLPLNILTLGLFTLIINALLFWFAGYITPGFEVNGFWNAFLASIILSILATIINNLTKDKEKEEI